MNTLLSWSLAILLAVGSAATLFAQPTSALDSRWREILTFYI